MFDFMRLSRNIIHLCLSNILTTFLCMISFFISACRTTGNTSVESSTFNTTNEDPKVDFLKYVWDTWQKNPSAFDKDTGIDLYDVYNDNATPPGPAIVPPDPDWRYTPNTTPSNRSDPNLAKNFDYPSNTTDPGEATISFVNRTTIAEMQAKDIKISYRAYLNVKRSHAQAVFSEVIDNWVGDSRWKIVSAKMVGRSYIGTRADSIVIYFTDTTAIPDLLYSINDRFPGAFIDEVPAETSKIVKGMSIVPEYGESFGVRLTDTIYDLFVLLRACFFKLLPDLHS